MSNSKMVIAAVKGPAMLADACKSNVKFIFDLEPNIETLASNTKLCKSCGKLLFIHIDLAEGIGKDKAGLAFAKKAGIDGVISTRTGMIKIGQELGLRTVQRLFAIDSQSIESVDAVLKANPGMLEIMPGIIPVVIKKLCRTVNIPLIAGGLITTEEDVTAAFEAGAAGVSTTAAHLWNFKCQEGNL